MNIPNFLTSIRILLIPIFIAFFIDPSPLRSALAAIVFGIAALTDLLDGYLARRWKQITTLGKLLDPIADKLLVLSALILLVDFQRVASWIVIVIIGREIAMTGLRALASSDGIILSADKTGKYKLFLQVLSILLLIVDYDAPYIHFRTVGTVLLWISMILAILSAIQYTLQYSNHLQTKESR